MLTQTVHPKAVDRLVAYLRQNAKLLVFALVFSVVLVAGALPARASFDVDVSGLMDNASTWFNAIWPILAVLAAIVLGFGIAKWLFNILSGILGSIAR